MYRPPWRRSGGLWPGAALHGSARDYGYGFCLGRSFSSATAEIFPGQLGGSRPDRDIVSCLRLQMALPVRLHRLMIQIPKVDAGRPQVQEHKQMAQKLVAEQLIEQARAATRLEHFDSDSHREGLDVFLRDVNACEYTAAGMQRLIGSVVGAVSTRLQVTDYLAGRPELLQRPVERDRKSVVSGKSGSGRVELGGRRT